MSAVGVSIVSIDPGMARYMREEQAADLIDLYSPDMIVVTGDPDDRDDDETIIAEAEDLFQRPVFYPGAEVRDGPLTVTVDGFTIISIGDGEFDDATDIGAGDETPNPPIVISNAPDVEMNMTELEATLTHQDAIEEYATQTVDDHIYFTGMLGADYSQKWGDIHLRGCAPIQQQGAPLIPNITVSPTGTVSYTGTGMTKLGLRAIEGVGKSTAEDLREAGYQTREDLATTTQSQLKEVDGIGNATADKILYHAKAIVSDSVVRTSGRPLPDNDPIFLTTVVDGKEANVVWQISVYDAEEDRFRVFLAPTPEKEEQIIQSFGSWLSSKDPDEKLLVAWGGGDTDYIRLADGFATHAPTDAPLWDSFEKFDLQKWVDERGNARLPSRGHGLRNAAEALGYEPERADIHRSDMQAAYRRWIEGGEEPDWDPLVAAGRDIVYSTACVYEAIAEKKPLIGGP